MSCLWRAMTIKQLFTSKATEKRKKKKERESCENANESRYAPKLLRRDRLLGQRCTEAHTVQYMCRLMHTHMLRVARICAHVQLGYPPYYVVQGFSRVSNDLSVTTFLLELESKGFRVQYIWLNPLQVETSPTVTTCLEPHSPVCVTAWYSASLFTL